MDEPGLFSSGLSDVADTNCSEQIRQARSEILGAGYQPVRTVKWNATHVAFAFAFKVDIPTGGTVGNVDIRPEEPVLLVFNQQNYPFSCPRAYSDRTDFPVSALPHINPTTKSIPAYLCLHRGNLDDWFAEHTVCDLVSRIRGWFRDAASGRLIRENDRFEATRIVSSLGICVYDDEQFNRYIENEWKTSGSGGASFIVGDLLRDFSQDPTKDVGFAWAAKFPVKEIPADMVQKAHRVHGYLAETAPGENRIIFGILIWPSAEPVARYFGSLPGDFKGLEEFAGPLGLALEDAIASYEKNDLQIIGGIPMLIAIPRPQKLIGANSATEFLSFVILGNKENRQENGDLSPAAPVSILEHRRPVTRKFARYLSSVSGVEHSDPRILVLGCGAQGSKLGMHLGKAGFTNIDFADHASLSPHNLIRHALLPGSLGKNKAEAIRDELDVLYYADSTKAFSARRNSAIEILRDQQILDNVDLLIDATASASVLEILVQSNLPNRVRLVRCELADDGRLGILLSEGPGRNPRIDDLQAALFDSAIEDERLSEWLKRHREQTALLRGPALEEIGIGISCSSDTMRLADDVVSYHSSLFSVVIRDMIQGDAGQGIIHINCIERLPPAATSSSFFVREVVAMGMRDSSWKIRLGMKVFQDLKTAHKLAGKNETGGLLIGFAHKKRRTIYVTRLLPPSPDSAGSPYAFRRGVQDYPEMLDRIHHLTGNMLGYVGEWHTHPKGAPKASATDLAALASISSTLAAAGLPAHILIVSPQGMSSFLGEVAGK